MKLDELIMYYPTKRVFSEAMSLSPKGEVLGGSKDLKQIFGAPSSTAFSFKNKRLHLLVMLPDSRTKAFHRGGVAILDVIL